MSKTVRFQAGGLIVLLLLTGCMGGISGPGGGGGSLSFSATEIHITESAVSRTGFSLASNKNISFERSFEIQGQSQTVDMNAHMVNLRRSYKGAPLGTVVALSLPEIELFGQQIPVAEQVSPISLIDQAEERSSDLQRQQKIGERSVSVLGENRTVEVFRGTAAQDGQSTRVKIYVMTFNHQDDTIVGVGIIPQAASGGSEDTLTLFNSIEYG